MVGRYAPSPTSALHLGNLRTALVAWLFARTSGSEFRLRFEDLDTQRVSAAGDVATQQRNDLAALGIDFDGEVMWQSNRLAAYAEAAQTLPVYECFCSRRDITQAASAPHGDGYRPYSGKCRELSQAERNRKRRERQPAWRIRSAAVTMSITDIWAGPVSAVVDDFVIRRSDGVWAYNFACVVDDIAQGVNQVVRGDDLLSSAPRQAWLTAVLGAQPPTYAHLGLVVNESGQRLAKRDGAVTLADLSHQGLSPDNVRSLLASSLGLAEPGEQVTADQLTKRFNPQTLKHGFWVYPDQG